MSFTVRLPVSASTQVRRAISRRARVDGRLAEAVLNDLVASELPVSSNQLLRSAIASVEDYATKSSAGPEWVSDHVGAAYQALADYREVTNNKVSRMRRGAPEQVALRAAHEQVKRIVHSTAMVNRKTAFGEDWPAMERQLLALIANGGDSIATHVRSIGEITVHGAGQRVIGADAFISKVFLESRFDRRYLIAVVTHKVDASRPRLNRDYAETVDVAFTPATLIADTAGVSAGTMIHEASSLSRRAARAELYPKSTVRGAKAARRLLDARNNFMRQYASRLAEHAQRTNAAVRIAFHELDDASHPRGLGGIDAAQRRTFVDHLFRQCAEHGVMFINERSSAKAGYVACEHSDQVVGTLVDGRVVAMCAQCAAGERW